MTFRLRHFFNQPKNAISVVAALALTTILMSWPQAAHAGVTDVVFNDILSPIVGAMIQLFALLTGYIVGLLVLVAQYPHFINAAPVVTGYPIVRDLANMMFIIALLIIAAGTVLRLENYRYNRLLGRLIVMAFLVNLARFITGFFIQTSQVFMLTFVNAFKDIALGNFAYMFGLDKVLNFTQQTLGNTAGGWALFITLVAGLAMMIIAFSVTLALVVILVVRIIALWILTILSPLAYALRIIPNTEKYASQWWSYFGKYLVTGPVLAFFLWLALAISASQACTTSGCDSSNSLFFSTGDAQFQQVIDNTNQQVEPFRSTFVSAIFDLPTLTTFIVSIIFLMMGMQFASSSGTIGARFAQRVYEGGLAAGSFGTGLGWLRDRTVAPAQGWIRNRQAARRAQIEERTAKWEYASDRTKTAFGSEKGLASARAYEQQQVTRRRQQLGMANFTEDQLYSDLGHKDKYRRAAALTELQSRGKVNTQDADVRQLTEQILSDKGLPPELRNNLRQQIESKNLPAMSVNQLRQQFMAAVDPETRMRSFEQILQKGGLNLGLAGDQQMLQRMLGQAYRDPQQLQRLRDSIGALMRNPNVSKGALESMADNNGLDNAIRLGAGMEIFNRRYTDAKDDTSVNRAKAILGIAENRSANDRAEAIKALGRNDADMLVAAEFNNLASAGDVDRLFSQHQQGIVPDDVFTKENQQRIQSATADPQALANHLVSISPDEEALRKHYKNMDPEAAAEAFKHGFSAQNLSVEKRNAIARVTGQLSMAFAGAATDDYKKFIEKTGGDKIAEIITPEALQDQELLGLLHDMKVWKGKQMKAVRKRGKEWEEAQVKGLQTFQQNMGDNFHVGDASTGDQAYRDDTTKSNWAAGGLLTASKGKILSGYAITSADETIRTNAQEQLRRQFQSTDAEDLGKLADSDQYKGVGMSDHDKKEYQATLQRLYGKSARLKDLATMITEENYDFGTKSLEAFEADLKRIREAEGNDGEEAKLVKENYDRPFATQLSGARNRAKNIAKDPILSAFAAVEEDLKDKKASRTEAAASAAETAADAFVGVKASQLPDEIGKRITEALREFRRSDDEPPTSPVRPTPPTSPTTGGGQAYRDAERARPFQPGAKIVVPPGSDFPSREERNMDPRIAALTPDQRALRQTAVEARRKAATKILTEDEKYDKEALIKGILSESEQADFRALEKRFGSTQNPISDEERQRYADYAVKMGIADPVEGEPQTTAQGARPPVRPAPRPAAPSAPAPASAEPPRPSRPRRPSSRPAPTAPTQPTNVSIDASALEAANRELSDIQRRMTSDIAELASNFSDVSTHLRATLDQIKQVRPNTAQQLSTDLKKINTQQLGAGDPKQVRNMQDILREIARHLREIKSQG